MGRWALIRTETNRQRSTWRQLMANDPDLDLDVGEAALKTEARGCYDDDVVSQHHVVVYSCDYSSVSHRIWITVAAEFALVDCDLCNFLSCRPNIVNYTRCGLLYARVFCQK